MEIAISKQGFSIVRLSSVVTWPSDIWLLWLVCAISASIAAVINFVLRGYNSLSNYTYIVKYVQGYGRRSYWINFLTESGDFWITLFNCFRSPFVNFFFWVLPCLVRRNGSNLWCCNFDDCKNSSVSLKTLSKWSKVPLQSTWQTLSGWILRESILICWSSARSLGVAETAFSYITDLTLSRSFSSDSAS